VEKAAHPNPLPVKNGAREHSAVDAESSLPSLKAGPQTRATALGPKISKTTPCTVDRQSQAYANPETFCHVGRVDGLPRRANHWHYCFIAQFVKR